MTEPLWTGDTGTLSEETRRALVDLLKGPLITADRKKETWHAITTDTETLRSRLHDVFLALVVDEDEIVELTALTPAGSCDSLICRFPDARFPPAAVLYARKAQ